MKDNLYSELYSYHKKFLKNISIENSQLNILFSGVPGAGKTTLSKLIEEKYSGVRLDGELIRRKISQENYFEKNSEREALKDNYFFYFLENFSFKNKLLILDRSIDRIYPKILDYHKKNSLDYLIICIRASKDQILKVFQERKNCFPYEENRERYIEGWFQDQEEFLRVVNPDIIVEREPDFDLKYLITSDNLTI